MVMGWLGAWTRPHERMDLHQLKGTGLDADVALVDPTVPSHFQQLVVKASQNITQQTPHPITHIVAQCY